MPLTIQPTLHICCEPYAGPTISYLTIELRYTDAQGVEHKPEAYFRGQNVGVGGKHTFCPIAAGEPVRRATQAELRYLDRRQIAKMLQRWPEGQISVRRSRHPVVDMAMANRAYARA